MGIILRHLYNMEENQWEITILVHISIWIAIKNDHCSHKRTLWIFSSWNALFLYCISALYHDFMRQILKWLYASFCLLNYVKLYNLPIDMFQLIHSVPIFLCCCCYFLVAPWISTVTLPLIIMHFTMQYLGGGVQFI